MGGSSASALAVRRAFIRLPPYEPQVSYLAPFTVRQGRLTAILPGAHWRVALAM